jgi:hypothetical protein
MNTMPQIFDDEPMVRAGFHKAEAPRAGFSVSAPAGARRAPAAHLKLVANQANAAGDGGALPYDLSARRHLARVPERQEAVATATPAQAQAAPAAPAGQGARPALEPIVFALLLLASVAALAIGLRAG